MRIVPSLSAALLAVLTSCAASPLTQEVDAALAELVQCPDLFGGRVGVMVVDAADGQVLAQSLADRGFAPASNNKLLATAVAFESLGLDHRFETRVQVDDVAIENARLAGNLYLVGGGDPTFAEAPHAAEQWRAIVAALHAGGIERIGGRVLGDGSWLGEGVRGHGWQWDYLSDDYAAPFGGLCAAGNVLELRATQENGEVTVATVPPLPDASNWVANSVKIGDPDAEAAVHAARRLGQQVVQLGGSLPASGKSTTYRIAVADPVVFAAAVATRGLQDAGMHVEGLSVPSTSSGGDPTRKVVATVASPSVAEIAGPLLTNSNNLYAEQLFRGAARVCIGSGQDEAARKHAAAVLQQLGVATRGLVMADGSGLSRRNLVQPQQLVTLLQTVRRRPYGATFMSCLPIAGKTGTLASRFLDGPAHGRVRAKTGFISRVVCLSGYIERDHGEPLIFSVMLNDFTCETAQAKAACDRFVQRLAGAIGSNVPHH